MATTRPDDPVRAGARISAQGWGHRYPGRQRDALAGVTAEIGPGSLVVLVGASGSGKSTLLAGLAGTLPPAGRRGSLEVAGPEGRPARVGLVQQEPEGNVVMELVGDDVAFPLENLATPANRIWPRVADTLAEVGLDVALDRSTSALSGGQTQLLAVAGACVAVPDLLLLDEPTANLDPAAAGRVLAAVARVRAAHGCTVVVVEHRVEPWLAQADQVIVVADGSARSMPPAELAGYCAAHPGTAQRMWLDHRHLPARPPAGQPGGVVLSARGVAVADRLGPTDLTLRTGEVLALVGPPGSGKSTLLLCLAGLLRPSAGDVTARTPDGERAAPWRWSSRDVAAAFGVVFQNPEHQFVTGEVAEELRHGLRGAGISEAVAAARTADMLDRLRLSDLAGVDPFTLSGGEQRRLSVGTALVLDPRILLLDEPTFGQDPVTWAEVVDIVAAHRDAGGAVVVATHDPDLVRSLGARELRLDPLLRPSASSLFVSGPDPSVPHSDPSGSSLSVPGPDPSASDPVPSAADPAPCPPPAPRPPDSIGVAQAPAPATRDGIAGSARGRGSGSGADWERSAAGGGSEVGMGRLAGEGAAVGEASADGVGAASLPAVARSTRLGRLDALALLGAAILLSGAALVSPSVSLNLALAGLALLCAVVGGLSVRRVALLAAPAVLATASVALSNALLSPSGITSAAAWQAAALPASRVLAVALPGLVAAVALDPTALADALVTRLRTPARAAYATLAALRLLPLLADEWTTLQRATRARGIGGTGPRARLGLFVSATFRLLVAALRRGGRLAVTLDARGLRSAGPRTVARPLHWGWPDSAALVLGAAALAAALTLRW